MTKKQNVDYLPYNEAIDKITEYLCTGDEGYRLEIQTVGDSIRIQKINSRR